MRRAVLLAGLTGIGTVLSGLSAAEPPRRWADVPGLLTGELRQRTLPEAAEDLGRLLGVPVRLGAPPGPRLDLSRRANLGWTETPVEEALREFCRAYGCRLSWSDSSHSLHVSPPPPSYGRTRTLRGFAVELSGARFTDQRRTSAGQPSIDVTRALSLDLAVRAEGGDAGELFGLGSLRVEDGDGRAVAWRRAEGSAPLPDPAASFLDDERRVEATVDWPYPFPRRLRSVSGEILLYRTVRRERVEVTCPGRSELPVTSGTREVQIQLLTLTPRADGFTAEARFVYPRELDLTSAPPRLTVRTERGAVRARCVLSDQRMSDGRRIFLQTCDVSGLPAAPRALVWDLTGKADPTLAVPFRIATIPAFPADLPAQARAPAGPARRAELRIDGVAIRVQEAAQTDRAALGPVRPAKELSLLLMAQRTNGRGEELGDMKEVSAVDDRGGRLSFTGGSSHAIGLPGERGYVLSASWTGPPPRLLSRLEGTLLLHPGGRSERRRFSLTNVGLPFGQPFRPQGTAIEPGRLRAPFYDPRGGALLLPDAPADREAAVGLSRRSAAGWTPIRWIELAPGERRIPSLQPGTYRVKVRYTLLREDGSRRPGASPARTGIVEIRPGAESQLR